MRTLTGLLIALAICGYSAAYINAWYGNKDQGMSGKQSSVYALVDAFSIIRDASFRFVGWLFRGARRHGPRAGRRARIHARSGRAAVNRWRADRRRPIGADGHPIPKGERFGTIGDPDVRRAMAQGGRIVPPPVSPPGETPRKRSVVTPLRQDQAGDAPGPASPGPLPDAGAAPAGAINPVFGALISWILDQEHPDSADFEEFHRQLSAGFLAAGEAMHGYTEHLAEGGIGLDPIVVQAAAEAAEATSELSTGIVDIFRRFHAVYAGYLAWLEDGHQNTHDGRWIRPESA